MFSPEPLLASCQRALHRHLSEVCFELEKAGIWHSLSSGTLLGAARQKGFIEWDDDVDIMIRFEDRERVAALLSKAKDGIALRTINLSYLKTWDTKTTLVFKDGQRGHPSLDIFCMGPVDLRKLSWVKWQRLRVISFASLGQSHAPWEIPTVAKPYEKFRRVFVPWADFVAMHNKNVVSAMAKNRSEIYSDLANFSWVRNEWFDPAGWQTTKLVFEGREFTVLANYQQLLANQYGDNWQKPPEKRPLVRTHVIDRLDRIEERGSENG